jgi:hypothetical protein
LREIRQRAAVAGACEEEYEDFEARKTSRLDDLRNPPRPPAA